MGNATLRSNILASRFDRMVVGCVADAAGHMVVGSAAGAAGRVVFERIFRAS